MQALDQVQKISLKNVQDELSKIYKLNSQVDEKENEIIK